MNLRIAAMVLFGSAALACGGAEKPADADKPAEAAKTAEGQDATKVSGEALAKAEPKAEAEEAGEEGCIYGKDHGGADHAEEAWPHGEGDKAEATGEPGHHGATFALTESTPLKDVLASAGEELPSTPIQVTGEVDSVCQKKGCWMVLKDGDSAMARILMKDHSFSVPMDAKGKPAIVEGTLTARTFTEKEVKHLEKDGGGDPDKVGGERKEFVLTASGVKIPPNS